MSIVMKAFNATDAKDIDAIGALLHDDFVYFNDYEMHSREDYLVALDELSSPLYSPIHFCIL